MTYKERLDHLQARTKSVVLRSDTRDILRKDRDFGPPSGKGKLMRAFWGIWIFACLVCLPAIFADEAASAGELLPPSRTLEQPGERPGTLSVFSEPPELDVYVDGKHIGKTPLWGREVKSGDHALKIQDSEKDIRVYSDKVLKIGFFRGDFVTFPETSKETVGSSHTSPSQGPQKRPEGHSENTAEQEKAGDVERWQRFILHGHF